MAEEIQMEEGIKKPTIGDYFRSGSCIGDPKVIEDLSNRLRRLFRFNRIYIYISVGQHDDLIYY